VSSFIKHAKPTVGRARFMACSASKFTELNAQTLVPQDNNRHKLEIV